MLIYVKGNFKINLSVFDLRNLFPNVSLSVVCHCKSAFNEKFNLETGHFSKNRANGSILLRNSAGREATK